MALLYHLVGGAPAEPPRINRKQGPLECLLIKNGRVLDPASKTDATLDVLLDGERIAKTGANLAAPDAEVFDATGMIVAPGFIDLHCHLREPGQEMSETIETGTRSAARGGFTAVCCMPNTQPVNDNASITRGIVDRAAAAGGRTRLAHRRRLQSAAKAKPSRKSPR